MKQSKVIDMKRQIVCDAVISVKEVRRGRVGREIYNIEKGNMSVKGLIHLTNNIIEITKLVRR